MHIQRHALAIAIATTLILRGESSFAAPAVASQPEQAISAAAQDNKTIFVLFYKEANPAADAMVGSIKASPAVTSQQATWTSVRLTDPVELKVAEKFKVTRAPMPVLVAVHPNGAVTGVYPMKVTQEDLAGCVVSPKMAECLKLLQDNHLVLICVQNDPKEGVPAGVREFKADPHFSERASILTVSTRDAKEAKFLSGMEIKPNEVTSPVTVFLAPPGVLVGKYPEKATKSDLATGLAAASKCCDDKNCKHNQKTTKK